MRKKGKARKKSNHTRKSKKNGSGQTKIKRLRVMTPKEERELRREVEENHARNHARLIRR